MTKRRTVKKEMTWEEFFAKNPGEPLAVLKRRQAEDVAWAEAHKDQPMTHAIRIRTAPGRPPKGEEAPVQVKAVKMPSAFWDSFQAEAEAAGLTLHAAMRNALLEWAGKHRVS
jgi:hypothetical protein